MFVYVCVPLQGSCLDAVLGSAAPPYNGQLQNTNTYEFVVVVLNGLISSQQAPRPTPRHPSPRPRWHVSTLLQTQLLIWGQGSFKDGGRWLCYFLVSQVADPFLSPLPPGERQGVTNLLLLLKCRGSSKFGTVFRRPPVPCRMCVRVRPHGMM